MKTLHSCAALALLFLAVPAAADERADAAAFLNETMKCAPPNEERRDEGLVIVYSSHNRPASSAAELSFRESYKEAAMSTVGGEGYINEGHIDVRASFADIGAVKVSGTKATVQCRSGRSCLSVSYDREGAYGAGREVTRAKKASFRISACSAGAARDIQEAVMFLSGQGG